MTQDDLEFLPQGIDYLGFLNAQLRDLRGYRTLANELIQNADDTPGATSISFDVRDDRLIVQNDGVFSDCGHVRNRACPWQSDPSMHFVSCDLHRFRIVASAGKRSQAETTGAFGVGFISVYQITDRPQLVTRGHHWQVRPEESEERRIRVLSVEAQLDATEFRLPWAFDQSQVREALGVEPVPTNVRELVLDELKGWIPTAILFLRRLRRIELRSNGESFQVVRVQRDPEDGPGQTLIKEDGKPSQIWQILEGGFEQEATQVRRLSGGRIEDKRKAKVSLAIPLTEIEVEGRFFATLPTDHKIGLPFHINSDFFPSSDRKRILLDQDYQGNWNRLAICKSATVLGHALLPLRESMAPAGLWALLLSVWSVHQQLKRQDDPFAVLKGFWEEAARVVRSSPLVWCYGESYKAPQEVFLPRGFREGEEIFPVYRDLGVSIVHPDLAASRNLLLEVKVPVISAPELARAMRRAGLDKPFPFGEAPAWLQAKENRDLLAQEIDALLRQVGGRDRQEAARRDLAACTLAHTSDNYLAPPAGVRKADTPTQALFSRCAGPIRFLSAENADGIEGLCAEFSVADAVRGINDTRKEEAESLWAEDAAWPVRLAQWFYERRSTLLSDPRIKAALRGLPVWPSGKHLRPLHQLSVPGDFKDPLSLASIVNADMVEACGEFLVRDLGALELSILVYATHHIPRAFESQEEVPHHVRRRLVRVLAENIGKLRDHQGARKALAGCSLIQTH